MNRRSTPTPSQLRVFSALCLCASTVSLCSSIQAADSTYTIAPLAGPAPASVAASIRAVLQPQGIRLLDAAKKPVADLWLRKAVPVQAEVGAARGTVAFPALAEGTLVGVLRLAGSDQSDFRQQPIDNGVFTLRYGLQPVDGDHLGTAPHRDFLLMVPADQDPARKGGDPDGAVASHAKLVNYSTLASQTAHPAVLSMMPISTPPKAYPALVHEPKKGFWIVQARVPTQLKGHASAQPLTFGLIIVGAVPMSG